MTGDKIYCVYVALNEQMIREHAQCGGFPTSRISKVERIIAPTTAEATA
ncbi:nickel-binding protein [Falsiroseomonas sp. E2-1-a20]